MSKKHHSQEHEELEEGAVPVESPEQETNADPTDLSSQVEELKKELEAQKDKYLRHFAEFENYKKRTAREIYEIRQTGGLNVITPLLEVLDDIDRAEGQDQEGEGQNAIINEGIQLIFNKFRKVLEQQGLKSIETMYTDFDVEKDEAISEIPVDDEKLKGKVVAEVQKGYMLNDKLIRFAKVVVGK